VWREVVWRGMKFERAGGVYVGEAAMEEIRCLATDVGPRADESRRVWIRTFFACRDRKLYGVNVAPSWLLRQWGSTPPDWTPLSGRP
jgi:hypothetical protein